MTEVVDAEVVDGKAGIVTPEVLELLQMDINKLDSNGKAKYLWTLAERVGIDPMTKPFDMIPLGGKLTIYANRSCAEQLRKRWGISLEIIERGPLVVGSHIDNTVYIVRSRATTPDGRYDEALGAVSIANLSGEGLANKLMACETKAKRRVTLSIAGLGFLDEMEVAAIPNASNGSEGPKRIAPPTTPQFALPTGRAVESVPVVETVSSAPVVPVSSPKPAVAKAVLPKAGPKAPTRIAPVAVPVAD